jgi:hypothetical protein
MKILKTVFLVNLSILMAVLILSPAIDSTSISALKSDIKSDSKPLPVIGPVYVGNMYISGDGNPDTAVVRSTSEQSLKIKVPRNGADVEFTARYYIYCDGWNDHGYMTLWVRGAPVVQVDSGEFDSGHLNTIVPNCKPGNNVEWTLTSTYCYLLLPVPQCLIPNTDGGAGVFTFSRSYSSMQKLPVFSKLLNLLLSKDIILRGNIIFT